MGQAAEVMEKKIFIRDEIEWRLSKEAADKIWDEATKKLDEIYEEYADIPKGHRKHTDGSIFPAAAIYLTLKEEYPDEAYSIMEESMRKNAERAGQMLQNMARKPGFKTIFLKAWDPVTRLVFGESSGFKNKFYPRARKEYRMDILQCPYNNYLTKLGCQELTILFCKNDEYAYGNIEGLEFIRTQTIGGGGCKCDFRLRIPKKD